MFQAALADLQFAYDKSLARARPRIERLVQQSTCALCLQHSSVCNVSSCQTPDQRRQARRGRAAASLLEICWLRRSAIFLVSSQGESVVRGEACLESCNRARFVRDPNQCATFSPCARWLPRDFNAERGERATKRG